MPIPTTVADLSTTPSSNYPSGGESPATVDDYIRAHASIIKQVSNAKLDAAGAVTDTSSSTLTNKTILAPTNTVEATSGPDGSAIGFRNKAINGNFAVDQRNNGSVFTFNNDYGGPDRWAYAYTGTAPTGQRTQDYAGSFALLINGVAGNTATTLLHRVESLNAVQLKRSSVFTVSLKVFNGTGSPITPTLVAYAPNSADNWAGATTSVISTPLQACPNGVWTTVTSQLTVITELTYGLQLSFQFGALTLGKSLDVTELQIEPGSVATPFEAHPYGIERLLCRNYFRVYATAQNVNDLAYEMRSVPTSSGSGPYLYSAEI